MTWEEINTETKPKITKSLVEKVAETIYNRHCLPKKYSFNEINDIDAKIYYYKTAKQIIKLIKEQ